MTATEKIESAMRNNPADVRFSDLLKVCKKRFGSPRVRGSHRYFSTPWAGEPLVNIQKGKSGKAKPYQVKQVLVAIDKLEQKND